METQFDYIMERIRVRQTELSSTDESKENNKTETIENHLLEEKSSNHSSPTKVFGSSSKLTNISESVNEKESKTSIPIFQSAERNEKSPEKGATPTAEQTSARKARFSALAQDYDDFQCDFVSKCNKPKEAYMKGRSPRMSIGETRPSVLCTPAGAAALRSPNVATTNTSTASKSASELGKMNSKSDIADKSSSNVEIARSNDVEERRIKFAQPIVNINYLPNESSLNSGSVNDSVSTVLGGSSEMMNVTTSSLSCTELSMNHQITVENTLINAQSCDNRDAILKERTSTMNNLSSEEYGAHHFMRRKVSIPIKGEKIDEGDEAFAKNSSESPKTILHTTVRSPKPFSKEIVNSKFSPVQFTPKSTSSPKVNQSANNVMSPAKIAALESARAKTIKMQFEEKLKLNQKIEKEMGTGLPIPVPRQGMSIQPNTPQLHHVTVHQKDLFPVNKNKETIHTPTLPGGVQTQFRGQHNTPVVQGAKAEDKTAGAEIVGAGFGKLKNLKSRWEFSSATGTPIHPDASEDSLIATAIKIKTTATVKKNYGKLGGAQKKEHSSASSMTRPAATSVRSTTASPAAKSVKYDDGDENDEVFESEEQKNPEKNHENWPIRNEAGNGDGDEFEDESGDELASTDASKIIDQAFDFMDRQSKMETPSPYRQSLDGQAPLAKMEESSPLKRRNLTPRRCGIESDVIEEEDVPMGEGDDDEDDDEKERQEYGDVVGEQVTNEWNEKTKKSDSKLPYSVSFYRKIQRERVADSTASCSTPVEPSAPMAAQSLLSPQVLKKLTGADEGIYDLPIVNVNETREENERKVKERIRRAIAVEDEHISQSKRALALCRETPTFRGSREEIEMQRALLIAVEKQRALLSEFDRLQKEGVRIIDGPRGNVTLSQLQVNLSRDYVQSNVASSRKSAEVHYFVAVLKWGEQVEVSKLVTSDAALNRKGVLDFSMPLQLRSVPPDFKARVEIYGQRSQRECFSHEDKYKLKGSTLKSKTSDEWCLYMSNDEQERRLTNLNLNHKNRDETKSIACKLWKKLNSKNSNLLGGLNSNNTSVFIPPVSTTIDSSFNLLGAFMFDIGCPGKKIYQISHPIYPLEGVALMKMRKQAVDGTDIVFKGFLSMYQKTREGLGSWTRYWCVLDSGEMKFWKHPEDEGNKNWLVLLDLATCIRSEGASTVTDCCPYPNSFRIDVWVPKEEVCVRPDTTLNPASDIEQLKVMLAADTQPDLAKWLSVINCSSKQLCTWRNPIV